MYSRLHIPTLAVGYWRCSVLEFRARRKIMISGSPPSELRGRQTQWGTTKYNAINISAILSQPRFPTCAATPANWLAISNIMEAATGSKENRDGKTSIFFSQPRMSAGRKIISSKPLRVASFKYVVLKPRHRRPVCIQWHKMPIVKHGHSLLDLLFFRLRSNLASIYISLYIHGIFIVMNWTPSLPLPSRRDTTSSAPGSSSAGGVQQLPIYIPDQSGYLNDLEIADTRSQTNSFRLGPILPGSNTLVMWDSERRPTAQALIRPS